MLFSDFWDYYSDQEEVKKRYKFKRKKELKIKDDLLKYVNINLSILHLAQ